MSSLVNAWNICQQFPKQLLGKRKNKNLEPFGIHYKLERILQDGKNTQILLVREKKTQKLVVLKKIDMGAVRSELIDNEISAGLHLRHSGIVKLLNNFEEGGYVHLVLEYIQGMDLFEFLEMRQFQPIKESLVKDLFRQIATIVNYFHKKGFVHRDLKLENIMLLPSQKVKIIDFGLCAHAPCNSTLDSYVGSVEYASPEVLERKPYNACKAEVWSLGVLLFALLYGQFPFSSFDRENKFRVELCFPFDLKISSLVKDLILHILVPNPENRFDLKDVLAHPWLSSK